MADSTGVKREVAGFAIGTAVVGLLVSALLFVFHTGAPILMLLLPAVAVAASVGGLRAGLGTTVVAATGAIVLLPPTGRLALERPSDWLRVATFLAVGATITLLIQSLHRARIHAVASERRFMQAFFRSPSPQIVTRVADRCVAEVNDAYLALVGLTREQLIGRRPEDAGIEVPNRDVLAQTMRTVGELRDAEVLLRTPDGRLLTMLISCHIVELHGERVALSSFVDLTARVAAEEKARLASDRFAQLAEAIREVFWLTDPRTHQVLYVSRAFEEIWGRPVEALYADPRAWIAMLHPDDRARVGASLEAQAMRGWDEQFRIVKPDGSVRWIHDKAFPIRDAHGEVYRLAGVSADITDQRLLEEQVRQSQKLDSIGQLAGGIAHDFNNLLNVIVTSSDLLREDLETRAHREMLDEIDAAVCRATALTRQLLAFSRKQPSDAVVLDVNRVVQDTQRMLRRLVGDAIVVRTSFDPEAGRVRCDQSQLVQVMMNLTVNARDAMPRGGTLRIETQHEDGHALLVIADDGCGMTPDVRARAFEPFFTTKEVGRGTGLGLAVVHGIVQQAGGTIAIDTACGHGTTITVRLPRVTDDVEASANLIDPPVRGTERILLVDDDWRVRSSAARGLRTRGYTVVEAQDGSAALRILDEHPIDLLVTDVVMPGMDGRRLFEAATRRNPALPVLFISGYTDDEVVHRGVREAELAFLEKPFRVHALAAKVRQVLDEKRA